MHPLDYKLYKKFNYINNLLFFEDLKSMIAILDVYINKNMLFNKKNNFKLRNLKTSFFNK
jgi:hypothetical protein